MAAVMALVFLPVIAAVGFMVKSNHADPSSVFAVLMFAAMAAGVFIGAMRMVRNAEN